MKKVLNLGLCSVLFLSLLFVCCGSRASKDASPSLEVQEDSLGAAVLQAPRDLNDISAVFAGLPVDADSKYFSYTQTSAWKKHSESIGKLWNRCDASLQKVGRFCRDSIPDIIGRTRTVLYTFSGPDFAYPSVIFPDADTLIMAAQERLGNALTEKNLNAKTFADYNTALSYHLRNSYFITKDMGEDLGRDGLGGVIPIFMFYMPRMGYQILSIDTPEKDRLVIKYFRPGENREKVLYYYRVNLKNGQMDTDFKEALAKLDPASTGALFKACSYCMHGGSFSEIRDLVMGHAGSIVQDDTGPRYKMLLNAGYDVTLYGGYTTPLPVFSDRVYQTDLQAAYSKKCRGAIDFRFGYNSKSSFIVSRKL